MKALRVKLRRDLWAMRWRALAIVLTLASGVAVYTGIYTGLRSLYGTRDSIYRELHFADLEIRFLPDDAKNLPEIADIRGVAHVERRLVFPGTLRIPGRAPVTAVMTFLEKPAPAVHSFKLVSGRLFRPDELDAAVIDVSLATYHDQKVGDVIDVKVGEATYRRRIVGIVITPEYFVSTSNPAYFIPEKGSVGFVFANLDSIDDALGFTLVNDLVLRFDPGTAAQAITEQVLARVRKLNVQEVLTPERHFAYRYVQSQLDGVRAFVPAIVVVLMTLTFIVVSVNVGRMIAADRPQIGALMALGYRPGRLLAAYLEASLVLGVIGGLLGLSASFVVRDIFATASASSMGMPEVRMTTDPFTMARGFVYEVVVALLATALPVMRLVRRPPHVVIRAWAPPTVRLRAPADRGVAGLERRLPAAYRYAMRNLARHRVRTAVTLGSIALGLGVAIAYRLSVGALDTTLGGWFAESRWDLAVDFLYPVALERLGELQAQPAVTVVEPYFACYVRLHAGERVEDSLLRGLKAGSTMNVIKTTEGRPVRGGPEREVVLTRELAKNLRLAVGETLEVSALTETYRVRLVGLSWAAVGGLSFVSFEVGQEICQFPDKASGAYVETAVKSPGSAGGPHELEFVGRVLAKRDLMAQVRQVLSVMIVVLDLATAVSLFVGMLVILTSINLSVLDNDRDFATLQALGYSRAHVAAIVLTEGAAYALGAALLSIPIAVGTSLYLNHRMSAAWIQIDENFPASAFLGVLLPALVLVPIGSLPGIRHVLRRDALGSMRARVLE